MADGLLGRSAGNEGDMSLESWSPEGTEGAVVPKVTYMFGTAFVLCEGVRNTRREGLDPSMASLPAICGISSSLMSPMSDSVSGRGHNWLDGEG